MSRKINACILTIDLGYYLHSQITYTNIFIYLRHKRIHQNHNHIAGRFIYSTFWDLRSVKISNNSFDPVTTNKYFVNLAYYSRRYLLGFVKVAIIKLQTWCCKSSSVPIYAAKRPLNILKMWIDPADYNCCDDVHVSRFSEEIIPSYGKLLWNVRLEV